MSPREQLRRRGVRLWLEDGELRYEPPAGGMTLDLLAELREHRAVLVEELEQDPGGTAEPSKPPRWRTYSDDVKQWPSAVRRVWRATAARYQHTRDMEGKEAEYSAWLDIMRGRVPLPVVEVAQRADGSWPGWAERLPARVVWKVRPC